MSARYESGTRVRVVDTWDGRPVQWQGGRYGVTVGADYADAYPTGAQFVTVRFDDGATRNVDTRVLTTTGAARDGVCERCGAENGQPHYNVHTWADPQRTSGTWALCPLAPSSERAR